jgi:hypothetical protein
MPSPWYVHPFEAHERGATTDLRFYSRSMGDGARAELFSDVLWKLYGGAQLACARARLKHRVDARGLLVASPNASPAALRVTPAPRNTCQILFQPNAF